MTAYVNIYALPDGTEYGRVPHPSRAEADAAAARAEACTASRRVLVLRVTPKFRYGG